MNFDLSQGGFIVLDNRRVSLLATRQSPKHVKASSQIKSISLAHTPLSIIVFTVADFPYAGTETR